MASPRIRTLDRLTSMRKSRASDLLRLTTTIGMLPILAMLIWKSSEPANWRWLTDESASEVAAVALAAVVEIPDEPVRDAPHGNAQSGNAPAANAADDNGPADNAPPDNAAGGDAPGGDGPAAEEPAKPAGPTDEDPLEFIAVQRLFEAVSDRTMHLKGEEMPAYWRLFAWSERQTLQQLQQRAERRVVLNDFAQMPETMRGKLFNLELNVRRILPYPAPENSAGIKDVYEIWGWSNESRSWPYVLVVAHLPPGTATGPDVHEKMRFSGYFFKLQSYLAAGAGPNDKPSMAPLLIGRVSRQAKAIAPKPEFGFSPWLIGLGLTVVAWLLLRMLLKFRGKKPVPAFGRRGLDESADELPGWLADASHGNASPFDADPPLDGNSGRRS